MQPRHGRRSDRAEPRFGDHQRPRRAAADRWELHADGAEPRRRARRTGARRRDREPSVVLITDGWQWCDPYDASTRFTPVEAVGRLADAGITVYVVGFGGAVDSLTLNRSAVRAGTGLPGCDVTLSDPLASGHCYHQANDLADLRAALSAIARSITDEACDGIDNDCDTRIDKGFDTDADGYTTCGTDPDAPGSTDPILVDCVDTDGAIHPGAPDDCDGIDNDCDGTIDPACACTDGDSRACGRAVGACAEGTQSCVDGRWGTCDGFTGPADEACDGADQDCDGVVDEDATCPGGLVCVAGACDDLTEPYDGGAGPPPDFGEIVPQKGGCNCRVAGDETDDGARWLAGLALVGVLVIRRRRRPRRP